MELQLETQRDGTAAVVSVGGEIDLSSAPQLCAAIEAAFDDGATLTVVDLSKTEFLDSSGLAALLAVSKQQAGTPRSLSVVCPLPHLRKLFTISHLDEVLVMHDSVERALADQ